MCADMCSYGCSIYVCVSLEELMMAAVASLVQRYHIGGCVDWRVLERCLEPLTMLDKPSSLSLACTCISRLGFDKDK